MEETLPNRPSEAPFVAGLGHETLRRLSQRLALPLRSLTAARVRRNMTFDDALILLAIGHLNFKSLGRYPAMHPVNTGEVSQFLKMPRETVRRRMKRLELLDLITIGPKGAIIAQLPEWEELADRMTGQGAEIRTA